MRYKEAVKALILGITGHIGNAIARELLARGYAITGISRRRMRSPNLADLPIKRLIGDILSSPLESCARGHDIIVDAAAPYPLFLPKSQANFAAILEQADQRTDRLLRAVRKSGARLLYISSFSTLPERREGIDHWLGELMRRSHPYFAVKKNIERRLLDAARHGVPIVVVNPTGCLGPWDCKNPARCLVSALLRRDVPGTTDQMLNILDVRDLAFAAVAALENELFSRPIAIAGRNISNDLLFRWICELGRVPPPPMMAPAPATVLGSYFTEIIMNTLNAETPLPALVAILTYMHGFCAPSADQIDLGVNLRPLSATLVDSINWYRSIGYC